MRQIILFLLTSVSLFAQAQFKNQNEMLAKYSSGSFTVYRNDQGKLEKVSKLWPITFNKAATKDANGNDIIENIIVKRSGVVDENFIPDLKEQPGYFSYESSKLIFFSEYAVYYKQTNRYDNGISYEVLYEFIPEGGSSQSLKNAVEDITTYRAATLNNQSNTRQTISKNKEEAEAKERIENSTKDKAVKSLKFQSIEIPQKLGLMSKIKFGVVATLTNGIEFKTKNLGGKTDFDNSYIVEAVGCTFADGVLEVGLDASQFPNDEIVLTIKNLNNPSQSITEKILLNYDSPFFTYTSGSNGFGGLSGSSGKTGCPAGGGSNGVAGNAGENSGDINIKIKEVKHKKTGSTLYQYEIVKLKENLTIKMKSTADADINIICTGGNGGEGGTGGSGGSKPSDCGLNKGLGGNGGSGGNGGKGGNITIIKQANSINTSFIKIENKGGSGGNGGKGGSGGQNGFNGLQGTAGSNGNISVSASLINFSW